MTDYLLTPLCELARKHGTDKGGWHTKFGSCHNYTPAYHELFKDKRQLMYNVLEIGIGDGASLRMWKEYFPLASITGIDNNPQTLINENRIRSFHADQGNELSLDRQFDLIVDDGSHIPKHQIDTANQLKHYLTPDGLYIIEDIFQDCHPRTILDHITWGTWEAIPTGIGLGGAHCECGCNGGEVLLMGRH